MMCGDSGYLGPQVVFYRPYPDGCSDEERMENLEMSRVRVEVEHAFAKVCNLWPYMMHYRQLKSLLQPVGRFYQAAVLLTNAHTCVYTCQTSKYFNMPPPPLEHYLNVEED